MDNVGRQATVSNQLEDQQAMWQEHARQQVRIHATEVALAEATEAASALRHRWDKQHTATAGLVQPTASAAVDSSSSNVPPLLAT